jgi:hypothetical protein
MNESLGFDGLPWPVGLGLALLLGAGLSLAYLRSLRTRSPLQRWVLLTLRIAALGVVLWTCLMPYLQRRQLEPIPPRVAVLLDGSPSMGLPAMPGQRQSRRDLALRNLEQLAGGPLQLELFSFASDLARGLGATGGVSSMHSALAQLLQRQGSADLKAVILYSDGRATDDSAARATVPVYTVPLGPPAVSDVGIEADALPARAEPQQPLALTGRVVRSDLALSSVTVELWEGSTRVGSQIVRFEESGEVAPLRFEHTPQREGLAGYRLTVQGSGGQEAASEVRNDVAYLATQVVPSRTGILLLSAGAGFESAFLGRQLDREAGLEVTRAVEVPGDRLVLGDGTTGGAELLEPLTRHAAIVVVGAGALRWIEAQLPAYVQAGGGLLLLPGTAGTEALARSDALAALLPLSLRQSSVVDGPHVARVAAGAAAHPLLSVLDELPQRAASLASLPPLEWAVAGARAKPGAQVLLSVDLGGGSEPVLAVQRYGQGRVGLLTAGALWNWRFEPVGLSSGKEEAYVRLLPRLVRWAASGGEFDRFALTVRARGAGEPVELRLVALDEQMRPAEGHPVGVQILAIAPDGRERQVEESALTIGAGGSADWRPLLSEPGVYRVRAQFDGGAAIREAAFALNWPAGELTRSSADHAGLQRLALESGGRLLMPEQLPALAEELSRERAYRMLFEKQNLWSERWLLVLVVGLLLAEWGLRRVWSLP